MRNDLAVAQPAGADPAALVGGQSRCPTASLVWQNLVPLFPGELLIDRLRALGGPTPPVQIIDFGTSFVVIAAHRVRNFPDEAHDCAKRAQFAAVFIAVAAGAEPGPAAAAAAPPSHPETVAAVPAVADPVVAPPSRVRLELGATAATALGGGAPTIAPGLALRVGMGRRRLIPVVAVTVSGPAQGSVRGVDIRQWQGTAEVDLRAALRPTGTWRPYAELGGVFEILSARPTTLSMARTQVSYAWGFRAAIGLRRTTQGRLSPFVLLHGAWFPVAPDRFALPAGDLGRAAAWNVGATAGAAWGLR